MKFVLFFCYMCLGLSISALAKCSDETTAMETVEWIQQLAEGAAAVSGKQDRAAAGLTHSSQKIRKSVFGQTESGNQFYIFVTLGMKEKNIKELMEAAKRYGGTFVIRGLHKGSMRETVKYFSKFASDVAGGFIIDPTLFRKYGISTAPAFVLTDGKSYDVLYGNVMPEFALREFAKKGDLSLHASELLLQ